MSSIVTMLEDKGKLFRKDSGINGMKKERYGREPWRMLRYGQQVWAVSALEQSQECLGIVFCCEWGFQELVTRYHCILDAFSVTPRKPHIP